MANLKFCDCFDKIMSILEISNARLSKILNVDPSLIARWRKGTRIPPYNSKYISLFVEYIKDPNISQLQKYEIYKFLNTFHLVKYADNILDQLENPLIKCQTHSIQLRYYKGIDSPETQSPDELFFYDRRPHDNENKSAEKTFKASAGISPLSPNDKLIVGLEKILDLTLMAWRDLGEAKYSSKKNVFFSFDSDMDVFSYYPQYYEHWKDAVSSAITKGHSIVLLLRISNNLYRTMMLISYVKPFIKDLKTKILRYARNDSKPNH